MDTNAYTNTGKHKVIVDHSNRLNEDLPLLLNVAGFTGVRIHRGNTTLHSHNHQGINL
ncbi:MAG: DUF5675 family protein [Endomicrobium sp.]|nr:DUF5675 family protein [Endomicrobium sp.]